MKWTIIRRFLPPSAAKRTGRSLAVLALVAAGVVLLYRVDPRSAAWLPKCPVHEAFGWHCPGCGTTRALHALLHGDWTGALSNNVLTVFAIPLLAVTWLHDQMLRRPDGRPWSTRPSPVWIWTAITVAMVFAILRNLPAAPFDILAPS